MIGYVFTYGVDGFGADIAPAHKVGVYLDFNKAFQKLVELNHNPIKTRDIEFYEKGYSEDSYPNHDKEMAKAEKEENWDLYEKLLNKHIISDEIEINKIILNCYDEPPIGFYSMEEIEIFS